METDSIVVAIDKMLKALDLHMYRMHRAYPNQGGWENIGDIVRVFKDSQGRQFEIFVPYPVPPRFPMGYGIWTIFKDDDNATFKLFTELIETFRLVFSDAHTSKIEKVSNPFFGCKSVEEVLIKCDLME